MLSTSLLKDHFRKNGKMLEKWTSHDVIIGTRTVLLQIYKVHITDHLQQQTAQLLCSDDLGVKGVLQLLLVLEELGDAVALFGNDRGCQC